MAELQVTWSTPQRVSRKPAAKVVVTGEKVSNGEHESEAEDPSPLLWSDKPVVVYVLDGDSRVCGFNKIDEVLLKNEKIALGLRAFRRVKMDPSNVEKDELLSGRGTSVPRMIFISPDGSKITVLEKSTLKSSTYFKTMRRFADSFYTQKLERTVKRHLQLLFDQDKVSNATDVLRQKLSRLNSRRNPNKSKVEKTKEELAELAGQWQRIRKALAEVWNLKRK